MSFCPQTVPFSRSVALLCSSKKSYSGCKNLNFHFNLKGPSHFIKSNVYRTPCIRRFNSGCSIKAITPSPIGIRVKIRKKPDKLYSLAIFSISPPT